MSTSKKFLSVILIFIISGLCAFLGFSYLNDTAEKFYLLDTGGHFITNVKDTKNLLKSDIAIKMSDKNQHRTFEANNFQVRDAIIGVLRSKSYDELKNPGVQETLKDEIKNRLCEVLPGDSIVDTYFREFVIQ